MQINESNICDVIILHFEVVFECEIGLFLIYMYVTSVKTHICLFIRVHRKIRKENTRKC